MGRALASLSQDDPAYRAWAEHALQQATSLAPEGNQAPAKALAEFQAAQQALPATNEAQPSPTQAKPAGPDQQRAEAETLLQAGQADQALVLYQGLVRADPQDRDSRMGVAASLAALGQVNEAHCRVRTNRRRMARLPLRQRSPRRAVRVPR